MEVGGRSLPSHGASPGRRAPGRGAKCLRYSRHPLEDERGGATHGTGGRNGCRPGGPNRHPPPETSM